MVRFIKRYIVLQIATIAFVPLLVKAQGVGRITAYHATKADQQVMPLLVASRSYNVSEPAATTATSISNNIDALLTETNGLAETKVNRQFSRVLKHIRIIDMANQGAADKKAYTRMADLFARLKLYPLAMKCYLKTLHVVSQIAVDNVHVDEPDDIDSSSAENKILSLNLKDDSLYSQKTQWLENHVNENRSDAIGSEKIAEAFNDGKTAVAYALLFHIKQLPRVSARYFIGLIPGMHLLR